jgi:beta-lactamase class A
MMFPDQIWAGLEERLYVVTEAVNAVVGLCVHDLITGEGVSIHGDEIFPTASTIKLHVLTQLFLQAERGDLELSQPMASAPWHTGGSGVLAYLSDQPQLTLRDLATLMIVASDNSAANLCIDQAGMAAVNAMLDELGLTQTRLRRKMMDHIAGRADEENVATPIELVRMLRFLYHDLPTQSVACQALDVLRKPKRSFISPALPIGMAVASKAGWSAGVRCDAGIVFQSRRPYALAIMLKYGMDPPEQLDAVMVDLARKIHVTMAQLREFNAFGHAVFA